MKPFSLLLCCCLLAAMAKSQDSSPVQVDPENKEPLFALLSEIKNMAEYKYKNILKGQELALDTIADESKDKKLKERQKLSNYEENSDCREAYYILKTYSDQLITQLKADLTLSNKKRLIKNLNEQSSQTSSWYKDKITAVQEAKGDLMKCNSPGLSGIGIADILGIFTAVVDIVKSSRDFRAQQIKSLCEQLDGLRLSDIDDPAASAPKKEDSEKEK